MIYLNAFHALSPLGKDREETIKNLSLCKASYFKKLSGYLPDNLSGELAKLPFTLPKLSMNDCRNNQFLASCIESIRETIDIAIKRYGNDRVGAVVGTSTSAITDVEENVLNKFKQDKTFIFDKRVYEIGNVSAFIRDYLNLKGPCATIAAACSSSARAFISAAEYLNSGLLDAVIVAGTDSLSRVSVGGFYSLGALSLEHTIPFHKNRNGINIGEGAGIVIASRERLSDDAVLLLGYGATSDAHHISAPEPEGIMASRAMEKALDMAHLKADDIGYVNLHGTGTKLNDAMEGKAIARIFGKRVPVSSTKHLTGHTLGAAGIVEAWISALLLTEDLSLPYHQYEPSDWEEEFPNINLLTTPNHKLERPYIMSNSFAFGGNNVSLIFGKAS